MRSRLRLLTSSYPVRLAAAFTGVGLAAAAVTAILVNLSFNALLSGYQAGQQQERRGIPGEDLPRVFERFYRGRRPRGRGSGIGLAVVRELVEAHGGRAMVESPAASGAVLRVVIPAQPPGAAAFTPSSQLSSSLRA
jgi:sensor histidine kinase regulating citrate/malate metabolism